MGRSAIEQKADEEHTRIRAAMAPKNSGLTAPDPLDQVVATELAQLLARLDALEKRVATLEGG